ncbi:MAG: mannose-1-phosphate guanylyltransferase/mannose-6-phosphate isomerase [Paracoccaceae bacterium]|nr:MAG: mannose-1-phosphate guanylyltransferase/mannose-6-phosphate isomerase [Paracoccaceae bacterium]
MITPVILCGGSGTRLWPSSRKSFPKQFSALIGRESLFQATLRRFAAEGFDAPLILTNADFRFLVTDQAAAVGLGDARILIEPQARNTAPAILVAALALRADPDALMLVAPSDHVIADEAAFRAAVMAAVEGARAGRLVTFGITPDRPETGYGWLELPGPAAEGLQPLVRFVEKPDEARAAAMLADGRHLWNAGIFLFRVRDILAAFDAHAPHLVEPCEAALAGGARDLSFFRLAAEPYRRAQDISIDYAVMEKAQNLSVMPFSGGWSDLGSWAALWAALPRDDDGVATTGPVTAIGCRDSLLRSEEGNLHLVGLGLSNIVAVAMRDAVLVADIKQSQKVREAVAALKAAGVAQAEAFPRFHRPWGWYETLCLDGRFQVKRIMVRPGGVLSLQSHMHRAEHWVVVAGTARVTVGEDVRLVTENQSVYIPLGARHRLENPGKVDMYLIEVQTGSYLGEDDIIRYEDIYARSSTD